MHKKTLFLTLLLVLLCFCGACQEPSPSNALPNAQISDFETYVATVNTNSDNISITQGETIWEKGYFTDSDAASEKEIAVFGTSYTASYQYSCVETLNSYTTSYYQTSNGIELGIRADTDSVVYFNAMTKEFFQTEPLLPELENAEDHAVLYATQLATAFIDPATYQIEVEKDETTYKIGDTEYAMSYYYVTFFKMVKEYKSSDFLVIRITSKGNLASLMAGDLGAFNGFESAKFEKNVIEASINAALKEVAKKSSLTHSKSDLREQHFAKTPDGKYILRTVLATEWEESGNTKAHRTTLTVITHVS